MHHLRANLSIALIVGFALFAVNKNITAQPLIFEASATNAVGILASVDDFRAELGQPLNGATEGEQSEGRREINWDGVPDADSAPGRLPGDFFNSISPRGLVLKGVPGISFQISANAVNPAAAAVEFANLNATYSSAFSPFSSERLFSSLGHNEYEVLFYVAGSDTPATVSGFGAVFADVDLEDAAKLEFFDQNGMSLLERSVLAKPLGADDGSLSFLGVVFESERVAKVKITAGQEPLLFSASPDDVTQTADNPDLVVLDDFLYGEPKASSPIAPLLTSPASGLNYLNPVVVVGGVSELGATLELLDGASAIGMGSPDSSGIFNIVSDASLIAGAHSLSVRATNSTGTGPQSASIVVNIVEVPDLPILSRNGSQVTVTMHDIEDATRYRIIAGASSSGKKIVHKIDLTTNSAVINLTQKRLWSVRYRVFGAVNNRSKKSPAGQI